MESEELKPEKLYYTDVFNKHVSVIIKLVLTKTSKWLIQNYLSFCERYT